MSDDPLSPLGMTCAVIAVALIALLPRRLAMMPILVAFCFFPTGESIQIAGLHFYLFRLTLLACLTRVVLRGEIRLIGWCQLDILVVCWIAAFLGIGSLGAPGWASFVTRGGTIFDWFTSYIVTRSLLRDRNDLLLQLRFLAIMIIPLAAAMILEKVTGRNVFSVLGGVHEIILRDGKVRAQAAFIHPILAGTFGAVLLPLMIGLIGMQNRRLRWSGIVGFFCAALIVWAAASSGPELAASGSVAAFFIWKLRHSLRIVHVGLLLMVLMVQAVMDRPVWWIFDSVGSFTGGSGWHRSYIIDAAIRHWDEWWLIGTAWTAHWGGYPPPPNDPNNVDITNEYVMQAVKGGALTLILFLVILWKCFKKLGSTFRAKRGSISPETEWLAWCVGVSLLAHCISFFSIAYFDRTIFYFFWLLSVIAAGTMERTWLIQDHLVRSVRRVTDRQSSSLFRPRGGAARQTIGGDQAYLL